MVRVHAVHSPVVVSQTPLVPDPSAFDLQVLASAVHPVVVAHAPFWHVVVTTVQLSVVATGSEVAPVQVSRKQAPVVVLQ